MPEGTGEQQQPQTPPEPGAGGTGQEQPTGGQGTQQERMFSQADVDRFVQERLARDRRDRPTDDEIIQLREKAAKYDEQEQANQSELEKAVARAEKAEAAAAAATEQALTQLKTAAILAEGAAQGAVRPEHLVRLIDTEAVTVGNDGQVTGAKEAVEAFLKANPEYVGSGRPGGADQGARSGSTNGKEQLTRADLRGMSAEEIVQAEKEGRLVEIAAGRK